MILSTITLNSSYLSLDIIPGNNYKESSNVQILNESIIIQNEISSNEILNNKWEIEIPKIGLLANIAEGTTEDILNKYVGHFSETSLLDGNIGLAAHNRGYPVNYFEKIKKLEPGDEIIYRYNGDTKKYIVKEHQIIKETDWSFLEKKSNNLITLITCVEDLPEYRRCIQGIEIKEE